MADPFLILITDRNRHVRDYLCRELSAEGYLTSEARDDQELKEIIFGPEPPDLLILDPELPSASAGGIMDLFAQRTPPLPVVIHSILTEFADHPLLKGQAAFVEKKGQHINELKAAIAALLGQRQPVCLARISNGQTAARR